MLQRSKSESDQKVSRQEKLEVLTALLGSDAVARLGVGGHNHAHRPQKDAALVDPSRAEWHRNKLLERFRSHGGSPKGNQPERQGETNQARSNRAPAGEALSVDQRLTTLSENTDLAHEHPAVIARILSGMGRTERIDALRSLPGPVARSVVQRMR